MATQDVWRPQVGERVRLKNDDDVYGLKKGATGIIDDVKHTWGQTWYYVAPDDPHPLNHIPYMIENLLPFIANKLANDRKCTCDIQTIMITGCTCGGK